MTDEPVEAETGPEHEIERACLGALLLDGAIVRLLAAELAPEHFRCAAHRTIFRAMLGLSKRGELVEVASVVRELSAGGSLDGIGGPAAVAELVRDRPALTRACEELALGIAEEWRRRGVPLETASVFVGDPPWRWRRQT